MAAKFVFCHSMPVIQKITTILLLFSAALTFGQPASYNFRHFTTADGLGDGIIRCIAQDKYGFMWFGSVNGLTIYNGFSAKVTEADSRNPYALKENGVISMCKDIKGIMWLAQASGIYQYEYNTGHFIFQAGTSGLRISKLLATGDSKLYIATRTGLKVFNTITKKLQPVSSDTRTVVLLSTSIKDIFSIDNHTLYVTTYTGIIKYDISQQLASLVSVRPVSLVNIDQVAVDKKERLWCSSGSSIYRTDKNNDATVYPLLSGIKQLNTDIHIYDLYVDEKGRLWIITSRTGLWLYNEAEDRFTAFTNDPLQAQSISTNIINTIFQSNEGTLWMGTEGYGLNYFNPDREFFHSLLPSYHQAPTLPDNWCRAASADQHGKWWLATATGVAVYDPKTNSYQVFQNKEDGQKVLYSNSVRSILCAGDGTIWIGTADGLNRYHPQTGKMDFIGEKDNIPVSFFWHIAEDNHHKIWFACRDGIYNYDPATNHFNDNNANKLLAPYCRFRTRTIFMDSHNRIWFGLDGKGLLLYDEQKGTIRYWSKTNKGSNTITDDLISSITEDKGGTIWMSTFSGLNAWNDSTNRFQHYYKGQGLLSNKISSLIADDANRLWMGTSKGLCMLDSSRTYFKTFGLEDGLATTEFNDQSAFKINGLLIFPTLKGFLYCNPAGYHIEKNLLPTYLSSFRVFNTDFPLTTNLEAVNNINLQWNQNFFSFAIVAPNYIQAEQTTYAYWLEPFDKKWIYTKERTRNYTNVPGGRYIMHVKATMDPQNWNVPETTIPIHIGTIFYKTWWFMAAMSALLLWMLYCIYRYRLHHHKKLVALQTKAQALEKEKAVVMYENLKQQLNPHFLFNSLSSLSGLIQKDQSAAKIFLDQLAKIYRYILKSGNSELVRISEDLKLAKIYVQLQQTRFGAGLQLNIDIDEEVLNRRIAPVTIQNLIENAIKHNIIDKDSPLVISITAGDKYLTVTNNLQKKSFVEGSNRQGLQNMTTLYRYLCGLPIITEETPDYFIIKIPFV